MKKLLSLILLLVPMLIVSETLEVSLEGTKPYTVIQEAIDQAVYGDVILVYPGHYYENIDLSNRSGLTLASLEYTTGNEDYISETIIDGSNNSDSTILCWENTTDFTIQGLSVTGGSGHDYDGQPHNVGGGGIIIYQNCSLDLLNLEVYNNRAAFGGGVGIIYSSEVYLENVNIHNNIARNKGGGLAIGGKLNQEYLITFSQTNRCSIYNNFANWGMDIHWYRTIGYTGEIYLKKFTKSSYDKYFADWFELDEDDNPEANPYAVFDVEEAYLEEIDADLYVSPEGDDSNSGLSSTTALKTPSVAMQRILSNPSNRNTVHLLAGTHHNIINAEYMSICVKDYTSLKGLSPAETKIYGENMIGGSGVVTFVNTSESSVVKDFSITINIGFSIYAWRVYNCTIENIVIENSVVEMINFLAGGPNSSMDIINVTVKNVHALYADYGLRLWGNDILIDNLTVENCSNDFNDDWIYQGNGALDIDNRGTTVIKNSKFINNVCESVLGFSLARVFQGYGWGEQSTDVIFSNNLVANNICTNEVQLLQLNGSNVDVVNCTIANNEFNSYAALGTSGYTSTNIRNNIFSNGNLKEIAYGQDLYLENNLFSKEETGNIFYYHESQNMLVNSNNIFGQDPLFAGDDPATKEYYRLFADNENGYSPAIDSGLLISEYANPQYQTPEFDLFGNDRVYGSGIDIGCFESPGYTGNEEYVLPVSQALTLNNYPNPFNPETTISFNNPESGKVSLSIYNIKGQLVKTLIDEETPAGTHSLVWNGKDERGKNVASGIYFTKIKTDNSIQTKKMLLMK